MIVNEAFDFNKTITIDNDTTSSHSHIDISSVQDDEEKLRRGIDGFLTFLGYSGFNPDEIFDVNMTLLKKLESHPDNDNFAMHSAVEEEVNKEEEMGAFIQKIINTSDAEFLKDVYRCWVVVHMSKVPN